MIKLVHLLDGLPTLNWVGWRWQNLKIILEQTPFNWLISFGHSTNIIYFYFTW